MAGRALHFVFKVADRSQTIKFYKELLGMKVLRHEEFTEGCAAACNGPYDNRWSKTMVGYGPEDTHFAIELTYNYNVNLYDTGNDFIGIVVRSREAIARAKALNWPITEEDGTHVVKAPGGYKFFLKDVPEASNPDPMERVILACARLKFTVEYWKDILKLNLFSSSEKNAVFGFSENQMKLEFRQIDSPIDHAQAYGRIAFSIPGALLPQLQEQIKKENRKILTPLVTLDTPGKASVTVVILADPNGHEICFVDDENFRKLSQVDPSADVSLERYIKKDNERKNIST